jgi:phosphohistidine phosphatase
VRHAIAEDRGPAWPDDSLRPLTDDGAKRWRRQAAGLAAIDARPDLILTSRFARARQTADLLAGAFARKPKVVELAALQPGVKPRDVLRALEPDGRIGSLALVGHEPGLGELVALLVGFKTPPEFKKGGVARIDVAILPPPAGSGQLHWWLTPKVLRELGS